MRAQPLVTCCSSRVDPNYVHHLSQSRSHLYSVCVCLPLSLCLYSFACCSGAGGKVLRMSEPAAAQVTPRFSSNAPSATSPSPLKPPRDRHRQRQRQRQRQRHAVRDTHSGSGSGRGRARDKQVGKGGGSPGTKLLSRGVVGWNEKERFPRAFRTYLRRPISLCVE